MLVSMKRNPPSIRQAPKAIPIKSSSWVGDIHQYLKSTFVTYPILKALGLDLLDAFPVELVLSIADFLPLEDIYCLSLCNSRLLAIFRSWKKREYLDRKARLSFLHRLERDHPRYLTCDDCLILHDLDSISEPLELSYSTKTYPPRIDCPALRPGYSTCGRSWINLHNDSSVQHTYALHFSHLQLAMRRFYSDSQYGISTDALSFTEVTNEFVEGDRVLKPTTLFSVEAQICPEAPSLYLRIQDVVSMKDMRLLGDDKYYEEVEKEYFAALPICKHQQKTMGIQSIPRDVLTHECSNCSDCNTDWEIELFENRPSGHVTMVMTRYIDLGPGLSLDDPRWSVHAWTEWEESVCKLDSKYMISSPRHTFEALTDTSLEDLTSRNLSYLENERYQTVMVPGPRSWSHSWVLWNGAAVHS
ncbi:Pc20g00920 [Penicillium rubens Wisconsin 54-1255]|uniref:Pc20g00920 protein n=2 Tax=Penicillium chrysogenum species complex TaxID=254878 RepID=B6HGE2_PENRW|nr:Pc20g00920 [Penicillium rubens Wisconsin 54-1255]